MTSEDVKDIRAYLSTIDPVRNPVTVNRLPFPLNQRMAMVVWDELYFTLGTFKDEPSKSKGSESRSLSGSRPGSLWRLPHAEERSGGDETSKPLQGYTLQGWVAPDITSGQGPLAQWSPDDVAQYSKPVTIDLPPRQDLWARW